jgi:hypothetical protein
MVKPTSLTFEIPNYPFVEWQRSGDPSGSVTTSGLLSKSVEWLLHSDLTLSTPIPQKLDW